MNARENSSTAWHYQVPLQKHYADRGQWLRMASVLSITREGPSVYLNERMEAAFEILQSDGSTRSTLSLPLSHAGNGPPAAPKDNDLPHKHAQAIFYSILSLWRGLHFLVPLLYNRWVDALCGILCHSFTAACGRDERLEERNRGWMESESEIGILRNFTNFNVLIPFPLNDLILH